MSFSSYIGLARVAVKQYDINLANEKFTIRDVAQGIQHELNENQRHHLVSKYVLDNLRKDNLHYTIIDASAKVSAQYNKLKFIIMLIVAIIIIIFYIQLRKKKQENVDKELTTIK